MQAAQDDNARISIKQLAVTGGLLTALAWLCYYFEIGGASFVKLMMLTVPAFVVHSLLPLRLRLGWFLATSLAAILLVLGPIDGLWLIGIVLAFIALCHLPVALRWRVMLLLAATGTLGYLKASGWIAPWSHTAWPVIASIFMFRMIIYLYDLQHGGRPSVRWSLAYFFMLPNIAFPLFPVVDIKKFPHGGLVQGVRSRHLSGGLDWICAGRCQLILYRIVYQIS